MTRAEMKQRATSSDTMNITSPSIVHRMPVRRGFSFAEVMFAVIILGIGFIMVAAIFPVAIQQTRLTVDESTAAGVARQAAAVLEQVVAGSETAAAGGKPLFPATVTSATQPPSVFPIRRQGVMPGTLPPDELWSRLRGSFISDTDPRFAWTIVYRRATGSPFIQVYIFVLQQRARTTFDTRDVLPTPSNLANLQARRVNTRVVPSASAEPDTIVVTSPNPNQKSEAEGAFIVIADGADSGHVYRLGTYRGPASGGGELYEVDPGYDVPNTASLATVNAWIVGRGFDPPGAANPTGPAMDVAFYTTFLTVN
jgi:type II secretory pathway pseudopilin PulG